MDKAENEAYDKIKMVRKGGRIGLVGYYSGYVDQFNLGAFMEKGLTISAGIVHTHKYYKRIFEHVLKGDVKPGFIITHSFPFSQIKEVYEMLEKHEAGMIKVVMIPDELKKKIS